MHIDLQEYKSIESTTIDNIKKPSNLRYIYLTAPLICAIIIAIGLFNYYLSGTAESDLSSVAILPFGNTIKDKDFEWLSQQFVDELTNELLNLNHLKIKDYSNVWQNIEPSKGTLIDLALAQKLGAEMSMKYIIYGNYLIFDKKQIRITANFADVHTGTILTSFQETYPIVDLMKILDLFPDLFKVKIENINLKIDTNYEK